MNKSSYQDLISAYKAVETNLSEKQKAEMESEIWSAYRGTLAWNDEVPQRRVLLSEQLGQKIGHVENRFTLLQAGRWASPLWDLFPTASYSTVIHLYRRARQLSKHSLSADEAIEKVIREYRAEGSQSAEPRKSRKGEKKERARRNSSHPLHSEESVEMNLKSHEFTRRVQIAMVEFLDTALTGVEPYMKRQVADDFRIIIDTACEDLRRQLQKLRRDAKQDKNHRKAVSRQNFKAACEVLGYDGTFGKEVDRNVYRKLWARRAASLHPDKGAGEATTAEYDAVNRAYSILEDYRANFAREKENQKESQS